MPFRLLLVNVYNKKFGSLEKYSNNFNIAFLGWHLYLSLFII